MDDGGRFEQALTFVQASTFVQSVASERCRSHVLLAEEAGH